MKIGYPGQTISIRSQMTATLVRRSLNEMSIGIKIRVLTPSRMQKRLLEKGEESDILTLNMDQSQGNRNSDL